MARARAPRVDQVLCRPFLAWRGLAAWLVLLGVWVTPVLLDLLLELRELWVFTSVHVRGPCADLRWPSLGRRKPAKPTGGTPTSSSEDSMLCPQGRPLTKR